MVNKSTFGQFLRQKRNEKGMTQKELAEKLFLSESAISKWEKGKSYPDITMIPDICSVLDISEHELISGANDTEYHEMKRDARVYRKIPRPSSGASRARMRWRLLYVSYATSP